MYKNRLYNLYVGLYHHYQVHDQSDVLLYLYHYFVLYDENKSIKILNIKKKKNKCMLMLKYQEKPIMTYIHANVTIDAIASKQYSVPGEHIHQLIAEASQIQEVYLLLTDADHLLHHLNVRNPAHILDSVITFREQAAIIYCLIFSEVNAKQYFICQELHERMSATGYLQALVASNKLGMLVIMPNLIPYALGMLEARIESFADVYSAFQSECLEMEDQQIIDFAQVTNEGRRKQVVEYIGNSKYMASEMKAHLFEVLRPLDFVVDISGYCLNNISWNTVLFIDHKKTSVAKRIETQLVDFTNTTRGNVLHDIAALFVENLIIPDVIDVLCDTLVNTIANKVSLPNIEKLTLEALKPYMILHLCHKVAMIVNEYECTENINADVTLKYIASFNNLLKVYRNEIGATKSLLHPENAIARQLLSKSMYIAMLLKMIDIMVKYEIKADVSAEEEFDMGSIESGLLSVDEDVAEEAE